MRAARVLAGDGGVSDLLVDGRAVLEWAASYLAHVSERPVLAQVEPGEIRSRLPTGAPEYGEPFSAVLRDLDEVLLQGVTHWQHPRFFAYLAASASEPGILAELLAATLNSISFLWRTAPAATELEGVVLDWTAKLLGYPRAGTATSKTVLRPQVWLQWQPLDTPQDATWWCVRSKPTLRWRRARGFSACACAKSPPTPSFGSTSTS